MDCVPRGDNRNPRPVPVALTNILRTIPEVESRKIVLAFVQRRIATFVRTVETKDDNTPSSKFNVVPRTVGKYSVPYVPAFVPSMQWISQVAPLIVAPSLVL